MWFRPGHQSVAPFLSGRPPPIKDPVSVPNCGQYCGTVKNDNVVVMFALFLKCSGLFFADFKHLTL